MKKLLILGAILTTMLMTGCETASELLKPEETDTPIVVPTQKPVYSQNSEVAEPTTEISRTQILQMTNDWTIMGDFKYNITEKVRMTELCLQPLPRITAMKCCGMIHSTGLWRL